MEQGGWKVKSRHIITYKQSKNLGVSNASKQTWLVLAWLAWAQSRENLGATLSLPIAKF